MSAHVHGRLPILERGAAAADAPGALVTVHGRGGTAEDILALARALPTDGWALRAPQAAGHTWYPQSFLAPTDRNEPGLSSGLRRLDEVAEGLRAAGMPDERIVWLGFSQGACLTLEYAARRARRWGGIIAFSGGLIGPDDTPRDYGGAFAGTPVFLGCSDVDFHIPVERVRETAEVLGRMGAEVDVRIYPGMGHTIVDDEMEGAAEVVRSVSERR